MSKGIHKRIQSVIDLADWYRKFKPDQKTITVDAATMKELRTRKHSNFYVRDDEVKLGSFTVVQR